MPGTLRRQNGNYYVTAKPLAEQVKKAQRHTNGNRVKACQFVADRLCDAIENNDIKPEELSIRGMIEVFMGPDIVEMMNPMQELTHQMCESIAAVNSSAFSTVNQQIIYTRLMDRFSEEAELAETLVETIETPFKSEKIGGTASIRDNLRPIPEGTAYPLAGMGEDYIDTPTTEKYGLIVGVTREAAFFDRVGLVLQRANEVGTVLGRRKNKRIWDVIAGYVNPFSWKGTAYNTYLSSGSWVNLRTSAAMVDWESVDAVEMLFAEMLDPNSGEAIEANPTTIIIPPHLRATALRILGAIEVSKNTSESSQGEFAINVTRSASPITTPYRLVVSRKLYQRHISRGTGSAQAKGRWYVGNPNRAFAYMQNWATQVVTAPFNSEQAFVSDVVFRFKASERGAVAVKEPREMVQCQP